MQLPSLARLSLRPTGMLQPEVGAKRPLSPAESEDTELDSSDEEGEYVLPVADGKKAIYAFTWSSGLGPECVLRFEAQCLQKPWFATHTEVDFKGLDDGAGRNTVWLLIQLKSTIEEHSLRGAWEIAVPLLASPTRKKRDAESALEVLRASANESIEAYAAKYISGRECVGYRRLVARYLAATDYILSDLLPDLGKPIAVEKDVAIADRFDPTEFQRLYAEEAKRAAEAGGEAAQAIEATFLAYARASYWRSYYYQKLGAQSRFTTWTLGELTGGEAIEAAVDELVERMKKSTVVQRWQAEAMRAWPKLPEKPRRRSNVEFWPALQGVPFRMPLTGAGERLVQDGLIGQWDGVCKNIESV